MTSSNDITYNNNRCNKSRLVLVAAAVVSFPLLHPLREFYGLAKQRGNITIRNDYISDYSQKRTEVDSNEFQREWSKVKNKLCPAGLPAHKKYGKLAYAVLPH